MTLLHLALSSLKLRWRIKGSLVLAVAITTTVLTGALLVGDSVSGSLRNLILNRLGRIDQVVVSDIFFPEDLQDRLDQQADLTARGLESETAIFVRGSLKNPQGDQLVSGVTVLGCRDSFWHLGRGGPASGLEDGQIVLTERLASSTYLDARIGDRVIVQLGLPEKIPAESPLGRKTETVRRRAFVVSDIISSDQIGGFSLYPSQQGPLNAFVALPELAEMLDQSGKANLLLVASATEVPRVSSASLSFTPQLEDYGLQLQSFSAGPEDVVYFDLTSERMMLPQGVQEAATSVWDGEYDVQPTFTYLANWVTAGSRRIPYSTVTSIDSVAGLGPLLSSNGQPLELTDDEMVLNRWAAEQLAASPGDQIEITYFDPETTHGQVKEITASFQIHSVVPLTDANGKPTLVNDRHFTPELTGVTDQDSIDAWDPPFPFDASRVTDRDEAYWDDYRATPKAFITQKQGERLWGSRFGRATSLRVTKKGKSSDEVPKQLRSLLERELASTDQLAFRDIRKEALRAAGGTTPFGILFLCFSLFLIISSLLLLTLLFRLDIDQSAGEWGLLSGMGFPPRRILQLLCLQTFLIVVVGTLFGLAGGIFYANMIVLGLRTWWLKAVTTPFVDLHLSFPSLAIGLFASGVVCFIAIIWSFQRQTKQSLRWRLLSEGEFFLGSKRRPNSWWWVGGFSFATAMFVLVAIYGPLFLRAPLFFVAGSAALLTSICFLRQQLMRVAPDHGYRSMENLYRLAALNLKRHPQRSLLTMSLVAAATFLITSVSAFRLSEYNQDNFNLIAESSSPIYFDLGTTEGLEELGVIDSQNKSWLKDLKVISLRVHRGDDASCLNLYRAQQPEIFGLPRGMPPSFHQAELGELSWDVLNADLGCDQSGKEIVPVILDQNTARYGLGLYGGLGEQFTFSQQGRQATLEVAGLLKNSFFQGALLIDESQLLRLFPKTGGYQYFLIGPSSEDSQVVASLLEQRLSDFGLDVESVADRLRALFAVQNTYLAAFQSLGGLGLLLGTLGLLAVQLRNVFSRRREFALLRTCGFSNQRLALVIVLENTILLTTGLFLGAISSGIALLPQLLSEGAEIPWIAMGQLLLLVLIVGLVVGLLAVRKMLKVAPIAALRIE